VGNRIQEDDQFRVVAYVTSGVIPENIPYDKLTHINYAFLIPNADGSFKPLSTQWKLQQIVEQAHQNGVKVLISVGGWGWDEEFETLAEDPVSRSTFVDELVMFVFINKLDGVDLDWEYPDPGESSQNFLTLVQELRNSLRGDKLLTTAVISSGDSAGLGTPDASFEYFDFINVMTYEGGALHGTLGQFKTGLSYWKSRGLPKEKIVMGFPFYAEPDGTPYGRLVDAFPEAAEVDGFDFNGVHLFYNGIPTVQEKASIAVEEAGGVMFWSLEKDHPGEYSLLTAIDEIVKQADE
jgi:GH18 family chitinase